MNELDEQLMEAAECGSVEEMRMLLAEGANVNAQDWERMTPLIHAAKGGHAAAVEELASGRWETKLEAEDADGETALMLAASIGDTAAAQALLAAGADANAARVDGWTALMLAAEEGHTAAAQALLAAGADANAAMEDGWTALMIAAQNGHTDVAQALLAAGANANAAKNDGETALMIAAQNGHTDVAQALLAAGADAEQAAVALRGRKYEAKGLRTLYAAGAFAPKADKLADCCRAALEGIAKAPSDAEETAALKKALDALWP